MKVEVNLYSQSEPCVIEYRTLLLQLIGSLTLCDHMGDVSNDVDMVLKALGIEWESPDDGDEWGALRRKLHEMGVTTLYGSELWSGEDEE